MNTGLKEEIKTTFLSKVKVSQHGAGEMSDLLGRTASNQQVFLVPVNLPWAQIVQSLTEEPSVVLPPQPPQPANTPWTPVNFSL